MKITLLFVALFFASSVFASPAVEMEKKESQAFLEKEAKVPKTEKTASGLLFREVKAGVGPSPLSTDKVTVEYKGTTRTGKVFDAAKGIQFPLNQVIPCWTEALQKMKVGSSAVIVCPSEIAYKDRDMGPDIKGGAALKFEVSLLKIESK